MESFLGSRVIGIRRRFAPTLTRASGRILGEAQRIVPGFEKRREFPSELGIGRGISGENRGERQDTRLPFSLQ